MSILLNLVGLTSIEPEIRKKKKRISFKFSRTQTDRHWLDSITWALIVNYAYLEKNHNLDGLTPMKPEIRKKRKDFPLRSPEHKLGILDLHWSDDITWAPTVNYAYLVKSHMVLHNQATSQDANKPRSYRHMVNSFLGPACIFSNDLFNLYIKVILRELARSLLGFFLLMDTIIII